MNTKPNIKRILCFGDSLTFGHNPVSDDRFPAKDRWTGALQDLLGEDFEIIEEGMGGRTTDLDELDDDTRNGFSYFKSTIQSHVPLDLLIILLGTNDLKQRFNRTPKAIAEAFKKYSNHIRPTCDEWGFTYPKILLVSPPLVDEKYVPENWGFVGAEEKSKLLAIEYKKIADELGFEFTSLANIVSPSTKDGVHLEASENHKIAKHLEKIIRSLSI